VTSTSVTLVIGDQDDNGRLGPLDASYAGSVGCNRVTLTSDNPGRTFVATPTSDNTFDRITSGTVVSRRRPHEAALQHLVVVTAYTWLWHELDFGAHDGWGSPVFDIAESAEDSKLWGACLPLAFVAYSVGP
jgi:hypothetical protein